LRPPAAPRGYVWVHVAAYAGTGNGVINAATGKAYDRTDPKKQRAPKVLDKSSIVFANDNGVAALSFAGSIKPSAGGTMLSVDLPAFNSAGLKGWLPLDSDLVDFRLVINNPKYLQSGACPRNKTWSVVTKLTYSPFPGDYAKDPSTPAYPQQTVNSNSPCS